MKPRGFLFLLVCICLLGPATRLPAQTTFQRTYGDTLPDHGRSVAQIADGGYVITGLTRSFGAGQNDVYLIKTNSDGNAPAIAEP